MESSSHQQAKAVLDQALKELKEIDESGGWEIFGHGKGVEQMRKPSEVLFLIRGVCEVPLDHETIRDFIWATENKKKYDPAIAEVRVLETLSEDSRICYTKIKTPLVLSDRESVIVEGITQDEDENFYYVEKSIDYPSLPSAEGTIRVNLIIKGFVIKPIGPRSASLSYIFNLDPRGSLPEAVVNFIQKSQAKIAGTVRDLLKAGER